MSRRMNCGKKKDTKTKGETKEETCWQKRRQTFVTCLSLTETETPDIELLCKQQHRKFRIFDKSATPTHVPIIIRSDRLEKETERIPRRNSPIVQKQQHTLFSKPAPLETERLQYWVLQREREREIKRQLRTFCFGLALVFVSSRLRGNQFRDRIILHSKVLLGRRIPFFFFCCWLARPKDQ